MAEYTQAQVTAALAAIIDAVDDTGVVLTDRRTCEEDAEVITLLQSMNRDNNNQAKGWLVTLQQISEVDGSGGCEIWQTLTFCLEALYPYQHRRTDGDRSETLFREMISAVMIAVRGSRNLELDDRVHHNLMQAEQDFTLAHWEGVGDDTVITHYAKFKLEVVNSVYV